MDVRVFLKRVTTGVVAAAMVASCATRGTDDKAARDALAPSGVLRIAVHRGSPSSFLQETPASQPRGVAHDLGRALAQRLGVNCEILVYARNPEALAAVADGRADFAFTNATPERARAMDLSTPILVVHKSLLVPGGSALTSLDALGKQGARVGALEGSTTAVEFGKLYPLATMVSMPSLSRALEALRRAEIDGLAANNAILYELGDQWPGSRVLPGSWGSERFGIGVPKGRAAGHAWLRKFSETVVQDGTLAAATARAGLRGVDPLAAKDSAQ